MNCHQSFYFLAILVGVFFNSSLMAYRFQPINYTHSCKDVAEDATELEIFDEFFRIYAYWQRPKLDATKALRVDASLYLSAIREIDEYQGTLTMAGFLDLRWIDELHVWNGSYPLNCITYLVLPTKMIWVPELALVNSPNGWFRHVDQPGSKVILYNDGMALFSPGGDFTVTCNFDFSLFPFDTQHCTLFFESWHYSRDFLQLHIDSQPIELYQWVENGEWSLVSVDADFSELSGYHKGLIEFDMIEFSISIRRKPARHFFRLVIPILLFVALPLPILSLQIGDPNKTKLMLLATISFVVFATWSSYVIPSSKTGSLPALLVSVHLQIYYFAIALIGTLLEEMALSKRYHRHVLCPAPKMFEFIRRVGTMISLRFPSGASSVGSSNSQQNFNNNNNNSDQAGVDIASGSRNHPVETLSFALSQSGRARESSLAPTHFEPDDNTDFLDIDDDDAEVVAYTIAKSASRNCFFTTTKGALRRLDSGINEKSPFVINGMATVPENVEVMSSTSNRPRTPPDRATMRARRQWLYSATVVRRVTIIFYVLSSVLTAPLAVTIAILS